MSELDRRTFLAALPGGAALVSGLVPDDAEAQPLHKIARFKPRPLLQADMSRSLDQRVLAKPVHARKLIDDMETDAGWIASATVERSYTTERARSGSRSMRVSVKQRDEAAIAAARLPNGSFNGQAVLMEQDPRAAILRLQFDSPQDWREFNRISLWCFVHPGNPINALSLQYLCDGASAGPIDPLALHYANDLRPGEWNHICWEIPEFQRDRISSFAIFQPVWGSPVSGASDRVTYDFDLLELHRVDAEPVSGWAVTPGQIAYCHTGYHPEAAKIAIAPPGEETEFRLIGTDDQTAATFPAQSVVNARGSWRKLDFTSFGKKGNFVLACGEHRSEQFPIVDTAIDGTVEAVLNGFLGLRCGWELEGVHDACHLDTFVEYEGERRSLGGGWHDAANLTQNANNSHVAIHALCELEEALRKAGNLDLAAKAEEEALWGLDWSLRLRFGAGLRATRMGASYYTNNKVGDADDVVSSGPNAVRSGVAWDNLSAALAWARSARMLKERDPALSGMLARAAAEDLAIVFPAVLAARSEGPQMHLGGPADMIAYASLASLELYRVAGNPRHRDDAVRAAARLSVTQERTFAGGSTISGWFYLSDERDRPLHEFHGSSEEARVLCWSALCEVLPDHADWMDWYTGLVLHSQFYCARGAQASAPFDLIPAAVWRREDLAKSISRNPMAATISSIVSPSFPTPETEDVIRKQMAEMFEAGTDVGGDHRLRMFPIWFDHIRHGCTVVHLDKASALAQAAITRGQPELHQLAMRQLEWLLGANPFSRSLIYGVGKDWWQNFTVELPNIVGGIAVGMNSYADDAPAWGNNSVYPYKEIWIFASARAALLLAKLIDKGAAEDGLNIHAQVKDGKVFARVEGPGRAPVRLMHTNLVGPDTAIAGSSSEIVLEIQDMNAPWILVAKTLDGSGRLGEATGAAHDLPELA